MEWELVLDTEEEDGKSSTRKVKGNLLYPDATSTALRQDALEVSRAPR